MNIVYGIQVTGNGHLSRGRIMVPALRESGHNVRVVISGREKNQLWGTDSLKPYEVKIGLTFSVKRGQIQLLSTIYNAGFLELKRDVNKLDLNGVDLVISDYEPIVTSAAKKQGVLSIGIGHQYAFNYPIPKAGQNIISNYILKNYAPVDIPIGLHWGHFNENIMPPIIPRYEPKTDMKPNHILVYLPWEDINKIIAECFICYEFEFFIYGPFQKDYNVGNIQFRKFNIASFKEDLINCEGVISNAGFELPSEVMALNKKLLVKPLFGQMEQLSNAHALKELSLGVITEKINSDIIKNWYYESSPAYLPFRNVARSITDWINKKNYFDQSELTQSCWN